MEKEKTIRKTRLRVVLKMLRHCYSMTNKTQILEPSAGIGDLADGIKKYFPNVSIDCVELNAERREILKEKGYNVVGEDFFKFDTTKRYDYIIASPTYKNNVDVEHIMHMWHFLKKGGSIVSLTSPYWTIRNGENQVAFRKWLEDKDYYMEMLPDNYFVENYETQPSMIIKITK